MKHHFKVFLAILVHSLKTFLEFRFNLVGNLVIASMGLFLQIIFLQIIFNHTGNLYGWSKYQVFLLASIAHIVTNLFNTFFWSNIHYLPTTIKKGELDMMLIKPTNTQFFASLRVIRAPGFLQVLPGIVMLVYSLQNLNYSFSLLNILILLLNLIAGFILLYSIFFIIATVSFWLTNDAGLSEIFNALMQPLGVPIDIMGTTLSLILTFIIPLVFVITVPVKIFFGILPETFTLINLAITTVVFLTSVLFWNFALKHYTSASS